MTVPEKSFKPGAVCPLEGTRVVDLSRLVSRNMVSCQLADFRAEVIKIDGSNATTFANPRFRSNSDQGKNGELCEVSIVTFIAARTLSENMEIFERAEVTAAPVYDIEQFMTDPHVVGRAIPVDLPDDDWGRLPMHTVLPRLSGTPGTLRCPAWALGEHTVENLAGLGLDRKEIEGLARDGAIFLGDAR